MFYICLPPLSPERGVPFVGISDKRQTGRYYAKKERKKGKAHTRIFYKKLLIETQPLDCKNEESSVLGKHGHSLGN